MRGDWCGGYLVKLCLSLRFQTLTQLVEFDMLEHCYGFMWRLIISTCTPMQKKKYTNTWCFLVRRTDWLGVERSLINAKQRQSTCIDETFEITWVEIYNNNYFGINYSRGLRSVTRKEQREEVTLPLTRETSKWSTSHRWIIRKTIVK